MVYNNNMNSPQMVKSANTNGLLDNDCDPSKYTTLNKAGFYFLEMETGGCIMYIGSGL